MLKNKWFHFILIAAISFSVGKFSDNTLTKKTVEVKSSEVSTQKNNVVIERETVRKDGTRIITRRTDNTVKESLIKNESKREEVIKQLRPNYLFSYNHGMKDNSGAGIQKRLFGEVYFGVQTQFRNHNETHLVLSIGF